MAGFPEILTPDGSMASAIDLIAHLGKEKVRSMPYSRRVLAENLIRNMGKNGVTQMQLDALLSCDRSANISLHVPRVILPDSSGVPVLMDLAALRDSVAASGKDPKTVDAQIPVDLVIDHSLQVDNWAQANAVTLNIGREFQRNGERYTFLKWAESAFEQLTVHPSGSGIIHQLNLENIAPVVSVSEAQGRRFAHPDFVLGGDSHTPMVNALGVLGWGVGGIEALSTLLGQPYVMPVPEIVGVEITGRLNAGVNTTDLALMMTQVLRRENVVGAFVEFYGPGSATLSVADRATISNMAPEYGATVGFWPLDDNTLDYLSLTGRSPDHVAFIKDYCIAAAIFADPDQQLRFDRTISFDLDMVSASMAGPSRPQDRVALQDVPKNFGALLSKSKSEGGFDAHVLPESLGMDHRHGLVAIAAITSCTNTANPTAMLLAGKLAENAAARGLRTQSWVKTSMAPGSKVVTEYLEASGLLASLEALGFHVVGYGCTTCGGKSGPLLPATEKAILDGDLVATSVLSGNRNFTGRIHKLVRANYLASPALVVAYALAGRIDIDWEAEPIGDDVNGQAIFLRDIWPTDSEISELARANINSAHFDRVYRGETGPSDAWAGLEAPQGDLFPWDPKSSYLLPPPFLKLSKPEVDGILGAQILGLYGNSLTTDHVSPGGEIPADSPAGVYLQALGILPREFNTYVGRRGNHEVMTRGTFANLRIANRMVPDREGWWTKVWPEGEITTVYGAAETYRERQVPLVIVAGAEYGTGSSRDWAAKGPALLGVRAVVAVSFERIHRSNLAALGIVPLVFKNPEDYQRFEGDEIVSLIDVYSDLKPGKLLMLNAVRADKSVFTCEVLADLHSLLEVVYIRSGGILADVARRLGE